MTQQNSPLNGKTIGSLFAGIGGFDLGFERAGFTTKWTCEIDQKAQAVLRLRFPHATHHDDVTQVGAHNLEPVDIVTFGSPCQDLSVAGKRAGLAGERSGLFHAAVDVISGLRAKYGKPDFAIWENVPGAFSSNQGRDFAAVLQSLADIGATDLAWRVLDSRFLGVAQRRRRVFLVVDFGGERAAEILALAQGVRGYSPQGRKAREGTAAGAGYSPRTSGAVTSKWAKGGGPAGDEHYNLVATHIPPKAACLETTNHDYSRADGFTAVAFKPRYFTRDADTGGSPPVRVHQTLAVAELAGTLGGGSGQRGRCNDLDRNKAFVPQAGSVVRRLTPVECCRLQGFPDDWNSEGITKEGKRIPMADAPRYRQLGNAVTVNIANWIANNLATVYAEPKERTDGEP